MGVIIIRTGILEFFFEAKVASKIAEFLTRYDSSRDGLWWALFKDQIHGSIGLDAALCESGAAHLRWFILSDALRGQGAGRALVEAALDWCRKCGYPRVYLWTFAGLDAARHLYVDFGFELAKQRRGVQWGTEVTEQRFDLTL
jgi:GNAT superfamily N-acetyltransferase